VTNFVLIIFFKLLTARKKK